MYINYQPIVIAALLETGLYSVSTMFLLKENISRAQYLSYFNNVFSVLVEAILT